MNYLFQSFKKHKKHGNKFAFITTLSSNSNSIALTLSFTYIFMSIVQEHKQSKTSCFSYNNKKLIRSYKMRGFRWSKYIKIRNKSGILCRSGAKNNWNKILNFDE